MLKMLLIFLHRIDIIKMDQNGIMPRDTNHYIRSEIHVLQPQ